MRVVVLALIAAALVAVVAALLALPVMLLWNWVGVDILALKPVGLLQAWGILVLSGMLFRPHAGQGKE